MANLPSGPGQTDKAHSQSVVAASDSPDVTDLDAMKTSEANIDTDLDAVKASLASLDTKQPALGAPIPVMTVDHSADAFTLAVWVRGTPTPGTSAIVPDTTGPGLDATDPPAARIVRCNPSARGILATFGAGLIRAIAIGGTSVVLQGWFYDSVIAKWIKYGAAVTITLATRNSELVSGFNISNMLGAKFYVQIVTVTGTVTELGWDLG